jgi:hypothetical protein
MGKTTLSASRTLSIWYEAPVWSERLIASDVLHDVEVLDFDGDGDVDIAAAEMQQGTNPDEIKIYRNEGSSLPKVVISNDGSHSMRIVDIDRDGDLDIVSIGSGRGRVLLYENQATVTPSTGSAEQDHIFMPSTISGPRLRFRLSANGNTSTLIGTEATLAVGTWIHAAAMYDGSTMKLYQDGVLVGSMTKSGLIDIDLSVPTWIGANPGVPGQVFDGRIDEVQLFNRALSEAEIANAMATPLRRTPPAPTCAATPDRQNRGLTWLLAGLWALAIWRRRIAALAPRRS